MSDISPEAWNDLMEGLLTKHREQMMSACKNHGISVTQMVTLVHLSKVGETRMGELADVLGITQGAVTPVIDRLVERHWVERFPSPEDRRSVCVRLTKPGIQAVDHLCHERELQFNQITALMQPDEVAALYRGLYSLLETWRRIQP